jgi:hypothetical protein
MKKSIVLIFFFIIAHCTLKIEDCNCQWVQTNGVYGGSVRALTVCNNIIFAGTNHGVFISNNQGADWLQRGLSSYNILSLTVNGNNLFVGTYYGIFYSSNSGINWSSLILSINTNALYMSGNVVYAGTSQGVYKTTNLGLNWANIGFPGKNIGSIILQGNNIVIAKDSTRLNNTLSSVFYSSDNGTTWLQTNLSYVRINSFTSNATKIFAGGNKIYYSTDSGVNWGLSYGDRGVLSVAADNNLIYAGTDYSDPDHFCKLLRSTNNGSNWNLISLTSSTEIYSVAISGNSVFAGTYNKGLYKSSDNGSTWNINGFNFETVLCFTNNSSNLYAGADNNNGVFLSTNFGTSWAQTSLNNLDVYCLASNGSNVFAGPSGGQIYRSTNSGLNWIESHIANYGLIYALAVDGNNVFAANNYYPCLFRSTNNGINWTETSLNRVTVSLLIKNNYIFAGTAYNGVFSSSDYGNTWIQTSLSQKQVNSIIINGNNIFAGTSESGVYKSSDNGINWIQTLLNNKVVYSLASYGNNIFAATQISGVYLSTNSGTNWIQRNQGWGEMSVRSLSIMGSYIFAGTEGYSVWRRLLSEIIGIQNISSEIPSKYSLYQNYPNPFNPVTKIRFDIQKSVVGSQYSVVTLKVFDIPGKEITTLVNETLQPGSYEVTFDGSNLPSGIYFYQLKAGEFVDTKKLILLK